MRVFTFMLALSIGSSSILAQKIKSFKIVNEWHGMRSMSQNEEILTQTDSNGYHIISTNTAEINQPDNQCKISYGGYGIAFHDSLVLNASALEAVKFYDSLATEKTFSIHISPQMAKNLSGSYRRAYDEDLSFHNPPFKIDIDTTAVLHLNQINDSNESYICSHGTWYFFSCRIIYETGDTIYRGISGRVDLSNSDKLYATLPIYCFFQQYPDLFVEQTTFEPLDSNNIDDIIFRFIRWQKDEEKQTMEDGTIRKNIQIGSEVEIVQKHHQRSGELTDGYVERILTKSPNHPHGIKVLLETGEVGRVKRVVAEPLDEI